MLNRFTNSLALAAAILLHGRALAGTIRHDRDPQLYLNLGADPRYASVGRFDLTKNVPGYTASGTLVGDRWVLTGAHVIEATTSGTFTVGGTAYGVDRWVTNPRWNGDLRQGNDLALVRLSDPVTGVEPSKIYTGRGERGRVATFVGFGLTGTGLSGAVTDDRLKRAGENALDGALDTRSRPGQTTFVNGPRRSDRVMMVDFDNPDSTTDNVVGSPEPTDLEFLISLGDSGGGAFVDFGGKKGTMLVGVHSFAEIPDGVDDSDYGDLVGEVRVSRHARWIRSTLRRESRLDAAASRHAAASVTAGLPRELAPDYATPVAPAASLPEPSGAAAALAAAALALRRRRRRGSITPGPTLAGPIIPRV